MKQITPSCEFLESSGESGGMVFNLPNDKVKELGAIFSIIDSQKQQGNLKPVKQNSGLVETSSKQKAID